jgi:rubrerythrin
MITPKTGSDSKAATIQEAIKVLSQYQARKMIVQRWVCEVCGMIHTGAVPDACESCSASTSLVQLEEWPREMNSRW